MKTALITIGVIIFLVDGFILYCCVRAGAKADAELKKMETVTFKSHDKNEN